MAATLDLPPPAEDHLAGVLRDMTDLVHAMLAKHGGEMELHPRHFARGGAGQGYRLERYEIGGGHGFVIRSVAPDAPSAGAIHWVRVQGAAPDNGDWTPGRFNGRHWFTPGASVAAEVIEIGDRIPSPVEKAA